MQPVRRRAPPRLVARLIATCALAVASLGLAGGAATLAACESAVNLAVTYGDASAALETGSPTSDAEAAAPLGDGGDGGNGGDGGVVSPGLSGCPCDPTQGLGCCMPASGAPFCTSDTPVCASKMGVHLRCVRPDPTTESNCCWHGSGAGAETALAAVCDGGPTACTADTDCAGSGETKCAMALCFGGTIAIGACGSVPPTCPQP